MTESQVSIEGLVCPLTRSNDQQIVVGHGSGGKISHNRIATTIDRVLEVE